MNMFKFVRFVSWLSKKTEFCFDTFEIEQMAGSINDMASANKINLVPLFDYIIRGEKINAIKEHSSLTGFGLKESKDEIERLMTYFVSQKTVDNS